jgi:hypothetical protein
MSFSKKTQRNTYQQTKALFAPFVDTSPFKGAVVATPLGDVYGSPTIVVIALASRVRWREACYRILDAFILRYWYIYKSVPLCNPSKGGGGGQETLKPGCPSRVEPLMGWTKPHAGGGPKPMYLYYNTFSSTPPP